MEVLDDSASAAIAQLGERQTEDLKVPGSIPDLGIISDVKGSDAEAELSADQEAQRFRLPRRKFLRDKTRETQCQ